MSKVIHNLTEFCDFIYDTLKEYWFSERKPKVRKNTVKTYGPEVAETLFFLKSNEAAEEILGHIESCFGKRPMKHFCIHESFAMTGQISRVSSLPDLGTGMLRVDITIVTTLGRWEPVI